MIEVLFLGKTDEEVKYAGFEMLNHLGVPFRAVEDLEALNGEESGAVLILPEASRLNDEELNLILKSSCSLIFVNNFPEILLDRLKVKRIDSKRLNPPRISGVLKIDEFEDVPFFYDLPIIELETDLVEKVGDIEVEGAKHLGVVIFERDNKTIALIVPQIFRSASYLLAGGEETLPFDQSERLRLLDKLGRVDGRKAEITRRGFLGVPIVNVYEQLLLRLLLDFAERKNMPLIRKWLYPRKCEGALCVAHDAENVTNAEVGIDAVNSFTAGKPIEGFVKGFLGVIAVIPTLLVHLRLLKSRQSLRFVPLFLSRKLMPFNPFWNFEMIIDIDKKFGVSSSFHFLDNVGRWDSDYDFSHPLMLEVMNLIREKGCKVSLHASFDSYNDRKLLRTEKRKLEQISGAMIKSVRQHYYRFKAPDTWRHQEDAGLLCDSSFGYAQQVGFRAGTCHPFKPFDYQKKKVFSIVEVPCIIEDGVLLQELYMALPLQEAFEVCKKLIGATLKHHGALTLGWHESIDRERTRDWFVLYKRILRYSSKFNLWKTTVEDLAKRFDNLRAIAIEKMPRKRNSLDVKIATPNFIEEFTLKIYAPPRERIRKILINRQLINHWENETDRIVDICVDLQKGENSLKIFFSKEKTLEEQNSSA